MDSFDWFERFFLIIHEANPEVAGIAQCVQCKAKTMLWFITWKEAFRQRKNKNGNVTNNQRHLFPISRQLTNTTGLLPRNHEENDRLWKVLAYSDLLTIDSHTEADQEEHDVITITGLMIVFMKMMRRPWKILMHHTWKSHSHVWLPYSQGSTCNSWWI